MSIVANSYAHVIGIDTHASTHTYAILDAPTGALRHTRTFPTTPAGLKRAAAWIVRCTGPTRTTLAVIEGIGSYGAGIARVCRDTGLTVVEPLPIAKALRGGRGKSDPIDAELIAGSVRPADAHHLREPRDDQGVRAAIRILVTSRDALNRSRTAAINQLTALVRTVDVGIDARHPLTSVQIHTIAAWRERADDIAIMTARREARRLARHIRAIEHDLKSNEADLATLVAASDAAPLMDEAGIGPVIAATILTSWSHAGRIRNEAAFAALAGVSPIPASSGNTTRHRLNRGGDRRLNSVFHAVILTRMRVDPATRDYVERRRAENKTTKDIRRILKRYLARH
uniref:IS110 family transposase n=1 Tax=Demequina maris TaxID=1638982 RepID=UPI00078442F8